MYPEQVTNSNPDCHELLLLKLVQGMVQQQAASSSKPSAPAEPTTGRPAATRGDRTHSVSNIYQQKRWVLQSSSKTCPQTRYLLFHSCFSLSWLNTLYIPDFRMKEEGPIPLKIWQLVQEEGKTQNIYWQPRPVHFCHHNLPQYQSWAWKHISVFAGKWRCETLLSNWKTKVILFSRVKAKNSSEFSINKRLRHFW